jgi:hypothetical protein
MSCETLWNNAVMLFRLNTNEAHSLVAIRARRVVSRFDPVGITANPVEVLTGVAERPVLPAPTSRGGMDVDYSLIERAGSRPLRQ